MQNEELGVNVNEFADVEGLFEDKKGMGGTYLSIFDFAICQRSKGFSTQEEAEANLAAMDAVEKGWTGPHERANPKTKKAVWSNSKPYDRMIGRIADISKHTKEFKAESGGGKVTNWDITILTGGKRLTLQLTWCDHTLKRFLKVAPNINFQLPLLISAFKAMRNGEAKQAVSFRQYYGDINDLKAFRDVDKWDKIPEYWVADKGPNGEKIEGATYRGTDGTILPPPIQDEEDDTWDYKSQNKFLAVYFKENILPQIKALAEKYGLNNQDTDSTVPNDLTHSGPPQTDTPVTVKPLNCVAETVLDLVSGSHTARIKQLAEALGLTADQATQKVVQCDLSELSDEAGRYVILKMEQGLAKRPGGVPPVPTPAPSIRDAVTTVARAVVEAPTDEDLWNVEPPTPLTGAQEFSAAVNPGPVTKQYNNTDNDDIEF